MTNNLIDVEIIRNIAIIAHVDHGKTTLVDKLLGQSGTLANRRDTIERVMDSNDLEKERGITILAKNTAIRWNGYKINIVDTPGHADFGGEVERILSMVDSVLLLVDAIDGPMPQTRFVTEKAFKCGLKPILVVNKIDRDGARPDWVVDRVFDLFVNLDATDEQLDFPVVYASAIQGWATLELDQQSTDLTPLFETIIQAVKPPAVDLNGSLQMQISTLDYTSYLGLIGIGRITRGMIKASQLISIVNRDGVVRQGKIGQVLGYLGLDRAAIENANAGDIVAITGIADLTISDTICDREKPEALPPLSVDKPTISIIIQVNDSPFAGKEGKYVTSRHIRDRLYKEQTYNIALKVEEQADPNKFLVSGRGELHLGVLIETMRREGFELSISKPKVILKEENGQLLEPYEVLVVDLPEQYQGAMMEALASRKGMLKNLDPDGKGRVRLDYIIPARGLIGFNNEFQNIASGTGILSHVFDHYGEHITDLGVERPKGVLISNSGGASNAFGLWNLQARGRMFIGPQTDIYEGMIVGIHSRDNDLVVNATKEKKLTNMRASGTDESIVLSPPLTLSLEQAMDFINDDELVEVTPKSIRLRKRYLKEHERKRDGR
jgi:GTP-binding protein